MADELKPCPCCGASAAFGKTKYDAKTVREQGWKQDTFHFVNCPACGLDNSGITGGYATREEASAAWNCRAESAPATPAAQDWRPISEAPKDGTRILAIGQGGGFPVVVWLTELSVSDPDHGSHAWCVSGSHVPLFHQPTHFMPLPAAPATEGR